MLYKALATGVLTLVSVVFLFWSAGSPHSEIPNTNLQIVQTDLCGTGVITILVQNPFSKDIEIYNGQASLLGVTKAETPDSLIKLPRIPSTPGSSNRVQIPEGGSINLPIAIPRFNVDGEPLKNGLYVAHIEVFVEFVSTVLITERFIIEDC